MGISRAGSKARHRRLTAKCPCDDPQVLFVLFLNCFRADRRPTLKPSQFDVYWRKLGKMRGRHRFRAVTPEQEKIAAWFEREAPHLGGLYSAAVYLLESPGFPARTHLICHAARDIGNRVPEVIAGRAEFKRIDVTLELDELAQLWSQNGLDHRDLPPAGATEANGAAVIRSDVEMPIAVFRHLQILVNNHAQGQANSTQKAIRMIESVAKENQGRQESLKPLARQWVDLTRWFQARTHAGLKAIIVDEEELRGRFQCLESYLFTLIAQFYEPIEALDDILEDTNG